MKIRKSVRWISIALLLGASLWAEDQGAIDLRQPIPELHLGDGRILKQVRIASFGMETVMAKWENGAGTIRYVDFPAEYQSALEKRRPHRTAEEELALSEATKARQAELEQQQKVKSREIQKKREEEKKLAEMSAKIENDPVVQEAQRKFRQGPLWIENSKTDFTKAIITIVNNGDSIESLPWRDLRGKRRDGSYIEPTDCRPVDGSIDFSVEPHGKRNFIIVFGPYAYDGNWLDEIRWKASAD